MIYMQGTTSVLPTFEPSDDFPHALPRQLLANRKVLAETSQNARSHDMWLEGAAAVGE